MTDKRNTHAQFFYLNENRRASLLKEEKERKQLIDPEMIYKKQVLNLSNEFNITKEDALLIIEAVKYTEAYTTYVRNNVLTRIEQNKMLVMLARVFLQTSREINKEENKEKVPTCQK